MAQENSLLRQSWNCFSAVRNQPPFADSGGDFIAGLKDFEKQPITTARVAEFRAQMQPCSETVSAYLLWSRVRYARNLIYRDQFFEVLGLCWLPGQRTAIHSHNGQLGWVAIWQGAWVCRNYRFVRPPLRESLAVASKHELRWIRAVELELLGSARCEADGTVAGG